LSAKKQAEGPLIAEKEISDISQVNLIPCQKARPGPLSSRINRVNPVFPGEKYGILALKPLHLEMEFVIVYIGGNNKVHE